MIPKIIHYCWFGRNPLPPLAIKCIESWKRVLPEYEIKEWNEDNFDLDVYPYAREAYDNRKFAFVTDIVRLYALFNEGGVYMDTDVEILKPLDPFLHHAAFSGFESEDSFQTGLMAAEKGSKWAKDNLEWYNDKHFVKDDGTLDTTTNVVIIMKVLEKYHFKLDNTYQEVSGYFTIYPKEYFCPKDYDTKKIHLTDNTVAIHHFDGSWHSKSDKMKELLCKILGTKLYFSLLKIRNLVK